MKIPWKYLGSSKCDHQDVLYFHLTSTSKAKYDCRCMCVPTTIWAWNLKIQVRSNADAIQVCYIWLISLALCSLLQVLYVVGGGQIEPWILAPQQTLMPIGLLLQCYWFITNGKGLPTTEQSFPFLDDRVPGHQSPGVKPAVEPQSVLNQRSHSIQYT